MCRPQDDGRSMGSAGSDMTISGLRRGPKEISKMKIPETAEAESEDTGKNRGRRHKKTTGNRVRFPVVFPTASVKLSVLEGRLVRNGQLLASLSATRSQHLAAVGRTHALAETMLLGALTLLRLIRSLHSSCTSLFSEFTDGHRHRSGARPRAHAAACPQNMRQ